MNRTSSKGGFVHFIFLVIVIVILLYVVDMTPYELYLRCIDFLKQVWHFIVNFLQGEAFQGIGEKIKENQTIE